MSSSVYERPGQAAGSAIVDTTRAGYVVVDQPKRFTNPFEGRKPGFWCGLPEEVLKPTYETFIHLQN
jgi:hypothetical protein